MRARLSFGLVIAALVVACSSSSQTGSSSSAITVTLLDAKVACQDEAAWLPESSACSECIGQSQVATCPCQPNVPFRADCVAQAEAAGSEPDCTNDVTSCLNSCAITDCTCRDACYEGHTACRNARGALDSCIVTICGPTCEE